VNTISSQRQFGLAERRGGIQENAAIMQQMGRVRGSMPREGKAPTEQNLPLPKIADCCEIRPRHTTDTESQSVANTLHLTSRSGRMIVQDRCSNQANSCA
jgi:hypothetical protein